MDKESKLREKKRFILEALKRRLAGNVYSRVTVQDVADEAGYSKGGILHYFPSKEDMYLELMREIFREIEADHARVLRENFNSSERASISALYGVERFVLDRSTIRILINLIMYGYEDEKIMKPIRDFVRAHHSLYTELIAQTRPMTPSRRGTDFDPQFIGRIAQVIVLCAGLLESIDPIDLDTTKLILYVMALLRG